MTQALTQIIRGADKNATHCIIWLHGLGATADDFLPILPYLSLQNSTKIIFPQAPSRAITVNNGMYMPGWYDIVDFTLRDADTAGIEQSAAQIRAIYQSQIDAGIPARQIYFAGFSQGGVIALHLGTRVLCGGILALSTYLAQAQELPVAGDAAPAILQMHGHHDPIVNYQLGEKAHEILKSKAYAPVWKSYDMGHEIIAPQISDMAQWLKAQGL